MATVCAINSALEDKLLHHQQVSGDDKNTIKADGVGNRNRFVGTDANLIEMEDYREVPEAKTWNVRESVMDLTHNSKFLAERIVRTELRPTKVPRRYARIDRRSNPQTERNISECFTSEIRQSRSKCPINATVAVRESRFDDSCKSDGHSSARRAKLLQQAPSSSGNSSTSSSGSKSSSTRHVTSNNLTGKSKMWRTAL